MKDTLKQKFMSPPSEYSVAPFWSWNEEMDGKELEFQMKDFKAHGIKGAYAHPRMGLVSEYLGDDFFKAWGETLEVAKKEDMKLYMYDEYAWPSGFAGGLVCDIDESVVGMQAKYRIVDSQDPQFGGEVIFAYEFNGDGERLGKSLKQWPKEEWKNHTEGKVMVGYYLKPFACSWNGGHPYVDLSNPETTRRFLKVTYDAYYDRFGKDFGTTVLSSFSDEANIQCEGHDMIPFGEHIQAKFKELNGYELMPNLPCIYRNVEGDFEYPAEKIRYDYYYTLHELWIENFVKPIANWCDEHHIAWTGHDIEHQWPQAHGRINPSEMTTYEFRQWPGFDQLLCDDLRETAMNMNMFQMYEIRSAVNQFNRERALCEAYGAGGYHSTIADYKRLGDFMLVNGINMIVPHLTLYSIAGVRKRDCPQSFDYRQPWWNEYTEFANYYARGCYVLSQGKMEQRILLLNPSTTGYMVPPEQARENIDHRTDFEITTPDMREFLRIVARLTDEQWDFDLGDEYSIARNTTFENGKFKLGAMSYDVVVISKNMANIRRDTARILLDYIANGGTVLVTGDGALEYVDALKGQDIAAELLSKATRVDSVDGLNAKLDEMFERQIKSSVKIPEGIQSMRRVYDGGRVGYFFHNHTLGSFETEITVKGDKAAVWDFFTGETHNLEGKAENGYFTFKLSLARCETLMVMVGDDAPEKKLPAATEKVELKDCGIKAETDNSFTVDHVSLETKGEKYPERYFLETQKSLFKANGFGEDPWGVMQKKRTLIDANAQFGPESAFTATYKFYTGEGFVPEKLTAAIERPNLWSVKLNGKDVPCLGADFLDPDIGSYDFSGLVVEGENTITLCGEKFNTLCELEVIILRGNFSVKAIDGKFTLCAPMGATYGTWDTFGMPFYPYGMIYSYTADLDSKPESAVISIGEHESTVASVTVNGKYVGVIGRDESYTLDIAAALEKGENKIDVRLAGSFRNLFGPYLGYSDVEPYAWGYFEHGRAAKIEDYELCKYGLAEKPTLKINK